MFRRRQRVQSLSGWAMIALTALACSESTQPLPTGSVRFTPPPVYSLWWSMAEACSGHTGALRDIQWYTVPNADSIPAGDDEVSGYWSSSNNRIVLIGAGQFNGTLVRHEMLHALLRVNGHPRSQFVGACAGLVDCRGACLEDAGPPPVPPTDTPRVPPDSLELGIELQPATPGVNVFDGYFTLAVTARNPADHAVVVLLPPSGTSDPSVSFTCTIVGPGSRLSFTEWAWDPEATYFAPGESKRRVIDLVEGTAPGAANIGLGTFAVQVAFGRTPTLRRDILLTP